MTSTPQTQIPQSWTPRLRWAFAVIITGFAIAAIVSIYEMWSTQRKVQFIVERALASIQLAAALSHDIDQERLLLLNHITDTATTSVSHVRGELDNADARIRSTSLAYEPTIVTEEERAVWLNLQAQIQTVRPKIRRVLDLSAIDGNVKAQAAMKAIEPEFDSLDRTDDALVRINRREADQEVDEIHKLQRVAVIVLAVLATVWTGFALSLANWVADLIRRRETQMRDVTKLLEERNRELDAFAGRVAHDLRGPLTAINLAAFAREKTEGELSNAAFRRAVKQMETIIHDLLMLSRVSAQTTGQSCEAASAAAAAEQDLRPEVEAAGGMLRIEVPAATVQCSHGLLRQALWNLGENAIKYRRPAIALEITIRGRIMAKDYEFSVSDNGTGMSHSETQHAFEAFYRGEQVSSAPGTGLGLSIVKRVVEVHGGSVSVDSTPGRGSTFKISLPLASAQRV